MNRLTAEPDAVRRCRSSRGLTAAAAGLIVVFGLGACSSSGTPASNAPASSSPAVSPGSTGQTNGVGDSKGGVIFHGSIQVTGAATLSATFTDHDTAVSTCAAAAAHGDMAGGAFEVPSSTPYVTPNPKIHIRLAGFHGVGTYPPNAMQKDKADWISLKTSGVTTDYELTASAAGQVTGKEVLFLNKNGSGQVAFSEAHKLGKNSGPAIAGLISWTCSK
jgi:hypothetical protein